MLFFSSALIVEVVSSTRSARVTVLPHQLQLKASLCSLGQSSSSPRRVKCSPHPLHSRMICPEASTRCSFPSPCQDSSDRCMSFIPPYPFFFTHATIDKGGPHEPLGRYPSLRPRGATIGPTLPHTKPLFVPIAT